MVITAMSGFCNRVQSRPGLSRGRTPSGSAPRPAARRRTRRAGRSRAAARFADHLFATLGGQQNALLLETDLLGEFAVVQLGGGLTQTAYALVTDLVAIARDYRNLT